MRLEAGAPGNAVYAFVVPLVALIVTDERDRVVGLVPHVTLFAAAGSNGSEPDEAPERGPDSAHHVLSTATEGGGH